MEFDLTQQAQGVVHVKSLGNIVSPHPLSMPLVRDGYIRAQENYTDDWLLIYTRLNGGDLVLGDVVSTCQPSAAFLSNRELLVETCNGNDTALIATVITLDKQELCSIRWTTAAPSPMCGPPHPPGASLSAAC